MQPTTLAWIDKETARYRKSLMTVAERFSAISAIIERGGSMVAAAEKTGVTPPTAARTYRLGMARGWEP
jgi:hypothetical protein